MNDYRKKMCRDATSSHLYTSIHLGYDIEVVKPKVIQMQLYKERLVFD